MQREALIGAKTVDAGGRREAAAWLWPRPSQLRCAVSSAANASRSRRSASSMEAVTSASDDSTRPFTAASPSAARTRAVTSPTATIARVARSDETSRPLASSHPAPPRPRNRPSRRPTPDGDAGPGGDPDGGLDPSALARPLPRSSMRGDTGRLRLSVSIFARGVVRGAPSPPTPRAVAAVEGRGGPPGRVASTRADCGRPPAR